MKIISKNRFIQKCSLLSSAVLWLALQLPGQAQSTCSAGPTAYAQYKVTGAGLSKCQYPEFMNLDLPRIHIYHKRKTEVSESYSYSWSDQNGCGYGDSYDGGSVGYDVSIGSGAYWGHNTYSYDASHLESVLGADCIYSDTYSGGIITAEIESHDARPHELNSNNSTAPYGYVTTNGDLLQNNTLGFEYLINHNGTTGWFAEKNHTESGSLYWRSWGGWYNVYAYGPTNELIGRASGSTNGACLEVRGDCVADGSGTPTSPTHAESDLSATKTPSVPYPSSSVSSASGFSDECLTNPTSFNDAASVQTDLIYEYSDGELWSNIVSKMPAYCNGELHWGGDIEDSWYTPTPSDDGIFFRCSYSLISPSHASGFRFLWGDDPYHAELQKMKYRIGIDGALPFTQYKISWDVITWDIETGSQTTKSYSTNILGGTIYTAEYEEPAPDWDDSRALDPDCMVISWVENITVTQVPTFGLSGGGASSSPPGTGKNSISSFNGFSTGCSTCGNSSPSLSMNANKDGELFAQFSMGVGTNGISLGNLQIISATPDISLATPNSLSIDANNSQTETILSGTRIRQLRVPQALVDVVSNSQFSYDIRYYLPSQIGSKIAGIYQISGSPFVTWTIANPDASVDTFNRLRVTETRDSGTSVFNYTHTNSSWILDYPGGLREDQVYIGIAIITNSEIKNSPLRTNETYFTCYTVTNIIRSPGGPVAYKSIRIYNQLSSFDYKLIPSYSASTPTHFGAQGPLLLTKEIVNPDTNPQTTSYTYYQNELVNNSFVPLEMVIHADGSWQYYIYDGNGRMTDSFVGTGDQPAPAPGGLAPGEDGFPWNINYHHVQYYYYPVSDDDDGSLFPNSPRQTVEYDNNENELSQSFMIAKSGERDDIRCQTGTWWGDPNNLVTVTKYYTSGPNANRIQSIQHPNGTVTIYEYGQAVNGSQTNTIYFGQPNSDLTTIVNGTKDVTVLGPLGQIVSHTVTDIASSVVLTQDSYSNYDSFNRPQRVTYLNGTHEDTSYSTCCGVLESTTDRDGAVTQYSYDALKRQVAIQRLGITTSNVLDTLGHTLKTIRIGSDNSQITLNQSQYDSAGQLIAETNALGGITAHIETTNSSTGGRIEITINPDGGTITNFYYLDGSLKKTIGTATHGVRYGSNFASDQVYNGWFPITVETILNSDGTDSSEVITNFSDMVGHPFETLYSDGSYSQSFYNNAGQLWKEIDPDGVTMLYTYNGKGEVALTITAIAPSTKSIPDYSTLLSSLSSIQAGVDRISWTTNDVISDHGMNVQRACTYVWSTNNVDASVLVSISEISIDGLNSWQTTYRDGSTPVTTHSQTSYGSGGARTVTTTTPDGSYIISLYSYGRLTSTTRYDSNSAQISQTIYSYDAHGRQSSVTDARNGATTYAYNNADLVTSVTTPNPGNGSPQTTTTYYNQMLQATNVVQPDGAGVTNLYYLTGELKETYGARTYPVFYTYDYAGRMATMQTWKNFSGNSGTATTTWKYDGLRGWLTNKVYDGGAAGPSYTYTPAGRLASRAWARTVDGQPLTTGYAYDNAGSLTNVTYSDGITPGVTNTYDRLGRLSAVTQGDMTDTMSYNPANELLGEAFSGGPLDGLAITNKYDQYLRRTNLTALSSISQLLSANYGYDGASRLQKVSDGNGNSAAYSYIANSPLVSQIMFTNGTARRMTTTKQYDYLNRLTSISSAPSAASAVNFNYTYNSANQRTKTTLADGSYWIYQYDSLGQVISGHKYFYDNTPVPGQQFDYNFDDIGNRKQTKAGGDQTGGNQRWSNYSVNNLNQITSRDYPGTNDVIGVALATNSVTVNGQTAFHKWEYYQGLAKTNNTSQAQWVGVTVTSGGSTTNGNLLFPKTPQTFIYDADGNQTSDGLWTNIWDAENRLIVCESLPSVPDAAKMHEEWSYLPDGRWSQRIVSTWDGSEYVPQYTNHFVWDDKLLLAITDYTNGLAMSFLRGNDLSGTMEEAGGVGGLLAVTFKTNGTHFAIYDGNGNVVAYVNATNGTFSGNLEYGPFGEPIRQTGIAKLTPIRFSTQFADDITGDDKFLYRPYGVSIGGWKSKDPAEENNGANLYGFVHNSPVFLIDRFGLVTIRPPGYPNQLALWTASLMKDQMNFEKTLLSLCPSCGDIKFQSIHGREQTCTPSKCATQAHMLAIALFKYYSTVFTTEYKKFGDILYGWNGNARADDAPYHGVAYQDYDKGFGLKCVGWQDLSAKEFIDVILPFYKSDSQCFRAARVGEPASGGDSWINHAWVVIYGPSRGKLDTSMYHKGDYDIVVDPWPYAGALIINPHPYDAKRLDSPLLW